SWWSASSNVSPGGSWIGMDRTRQRSGGCRGERHPSVVCRTVPAAGREDFASPVTSTVRRGGSNMELERVGEAMVLRMRAGKANAINPAFLDRMNSLLDDALAARARALVITGYESFFSAGLDLPALDALDERAMGAFMTGFSRTMLRLFELPLP